MPRSTSTLTPPPANGHAAAVPTADRPDAAAVQPLTYGRDQLAAALGISAATLDRLDAAGSIGPRSFRLGGRKLWSRSEVEDWLRRRDQGGELYGRAEWEAVRRATGA